MENKKKKLGKIGAIKTQSKTTKESKVTSQSIKDSAKGDLPSLVSNLVGKELELYESIVTPDDNLIITDIANGKTKDFIVEKHKISIDYYNNLVSNPVIAKKIKEYTLANTYANKDITLRLNNGVINALYEKFMERTSELSEMPLDKLLKALKDQLDIQHKMTADNKVDVKIDLTTLINENVRKDRIKVSDNDIEIASMFPVINENGEVIGSWDGIEGGEIND